jgi:4a-hydroxytetrahydrobiopterin dehydratase
MSLIEQRCLPCEGGLPPLSPEKIATLLQQLTAWEVNTENTKITRKFTFKNFYHTMAFVNAIAWIANQENHHPDLELGYNYCNVSYSTHAINGLSENDFICAAKIDALLVAQQAAVCGLK